MRFTWENHKSDGNSKYTIERRYAVCKCKCMQCNNASSFCIWNLNNRLFEETKQNEEEEGKKESNRFSGIYIPVEWEMPQINQRAILRPQIEFPLYKISRIWLIWINIPVRKKETIFLYRLVRTKVDGTKIIFPLKLISMLGIILEIQKKKKTKQSWNYPSDPTGCGFKL